jgi:type II secretion system protein N
MADQKPKLWKRVVGYGLFSGFALVSAFFLTFPYEALKERLRLEADQAGYSVRIGSLGPGLFGVRAKDVELMKKVEGDTPAEPLRIDSLSVGPSLLPPGVAVTAKLMGGVVRARASAGGRVIIDAEDLDLTHGNVKGFSGIDFAGTLEAHVDLTVPRSGTGATAEADLSQASGTIVLETHGLTINGGTANVTIAQFGPEPTPLDLPKIVFGDFSGHLKFDKGAGTIEEFKSVSPDIPVQVTGTLKMAKRLEYAEPALEVRFKPDPEFQKRLGLIGSALSVVGSDPKDPQWRMGRLTGYLGRPAFH